MTHTVALRKESVDRNLWWGVRKAVGSLSLSARRAWIEIPRARIQYYPQPVALRKESVDRNRKINARRCKEVKSLSARRAWIEIQINVSTVVGVLSLSARRAWIEILAQRLADMSNASLSARRAWIEILSAVLTELLILVALRKESVDRNCRMTAEK